MSVIAAVGLDILLPIKPFLYSFHMSILSMIWLNEYKYTQRCISGCHVGVRVLAELVMREPFVRPRG